MKRGGIENVKTIGLARALKIERWGAVGILESMWHWTARVAPTGALAGYEADDISAAIGWKKDGNKLFDALVATGWLDECDGGVIVHAWSEHCDDAVHRMLARGGKCFADGTIPRLTRLTQEERDAILSAKNAPDGRPEGAQKAPGGRPESALALSLKPLASSLTDDLASLGRRARAQRAIRLPDDFALTEKRRTFAVEGGLDAELEMQAFKDHHRAKGTRFVEWDAGWRTWCRRAADFAEARATRSGRR